MSSEDKKVTTGCLLCAYLAVCLLMRYCKTSNEYKASASV